MFYLKHNITNGKQEKIKKLAKANGPIENSASAFILLFKEECL